MKKLLAIFALAGAMMAAAGTAAHAVYFDANVTEIPAFVLGMDYAGQAFGTFLNVAVLSASFNINDNIALQARFKDTYLDFTNATVTTNDRNKYYFDRANFSLSLPKISLTAGRALFVEGSGLLVGGIADGLSVKTSLLKMNERFYVLYSGFLPKDINPFNANTFDKLNGANRMAAGLSIEKYGLAVKSVSLKYFYTMDFSTNTNGIYSPMYGALEFSGMIKNFLGYSGNFVYAFGGGVDPVSAVAFDARIYLMLKKLANTEVMVRYSYAGGASTNAVKNGNFKTFGYYDTGFVLNPDFSNLSIFKAGVTSRFWGGRLFVNANYYYLLLNSAADRVGGYYDGTGTAVGSEVSGTVTAKIDANVAVFANAGVFFEGDSFATNRTVHKVVAGVQLDF